MSSNRLVSKSLDPPDIIAFKGVVSDYNNYTSNHVSLIIGFTSTLITVLLNESLANGSSEMGGVESELADSTTST